LPTITEDEATGKAKSSKPKTTKKDKAVDKSRAKENRTNPNMNNSSVSNGDNSIDSVAVAVIKGQTRTAMDSIELTGFSKGRDANVNKSRDSTDGGSSPHPSKHTPSSAKPPSTMKTSISNKDIKNAKQNSGHARNLSAGSTGSENQSTDL